MCSMVGLGKTLLPGALFTLATQAKAQSSPIVGGSEVKASTDSMPKITPGMIDAAAVIAGISITDEQKKMMLEGLEQLRKSYTAIRDLKMPNSVAPAFVFDPVPGGMTLDTVKKPMKRKDNGKTEMATVVTTVQVTVTGTLTAYRPVAK